MNGCENVIIACGPYLLSEERKKNAEFKTCSEQDKRKENFTLFGRLNDDRRISFSNILELVFRNLKTWNMCCTQRLKRRIHDGDGA
jgi:hypothetical protein